MSDNEENSRPTKFEALGLLVKNPLLGNSNDGDVESNEIPASGMKETNEITGEKINDFDNEDIQRRMNNLIQELKSESITPDDPNVRRRKSVTSAHLIDGEENTSEPIIDGSSLNKPSQEPRRSMSESALLETNEIPSTIPIQPVESTTDDDSDETDMKKQGQSIKPTRSGDTSRKSSGAQKRPSSVLSSEKRTQLLNDTNRKGANESRRSSRSPQRTPTIAEPQRTGSSSSSSSNHRKQTFEPPIAIISPASRQHSANKLNQQRIGSRPSTARRSQHNDDSSDSSITDRSHNRQLTKDEQSKLIKLGEQLQIPTHDIDNQRLNSPPPSPSTKDQTPLTNPLSTNNFSKANQKNSSRQGSQSSRRSSTNISINQEKHKQNDVMSNKSRTSSRGSQKHPKISDEKRSSLPSGRESQASIHNEKNLQDSRRSSTDADLPIRTSAKQKQERASSNGKSKSPTQKRSAQQSRTNSSNKAHRTVGSPIKINSAKSQEQNEKRSSIPDSDNERKIPKLSRLHSSSETSTPRNDTRTNTWTKQAPTSTDDDTRISRPQSPNVEQIAERNPQTSNQKKHLTKDRKEKVPKRRSNSAESLNHIRMVDDKSLDSTSGNNTESDYPKQRRVKSKKKDVETNTDARNGNQQQQETTSQKSSKSMSSQSPSIRRRIGAKQYQAITPDTEADSNPPTERRSSKKPKRIVRQSNDKNEFLTDGSRSFKENEQILPLLTDHERHTQSDTEQVLGKKQKKRRRPKRISRTTQTYECVFRRMELDQHEELRPTNDTEKCIQTRRSCLRPVTRSPKRHYPLYLSTDAFKIEEILPKQFPPSQRSTNISRTSVTTRNPSPLGGKLLILRPTLPIHHTDAVNIHRINLQYSIDLIPNENKSNDSGLTSQRNKNNALKSSEETNTLPMIRSSSSTANQPTTKTNSKDRSTSNKFDNRSYQRKTGGAV